MQDTIATLNKKRNELEGNASLLVKILYLSSIRKWCCWKKQSYWSSALILLNLTLSSNFHYLLVTVGIRRNFFIVIQTSNFKRQISPDVFQEDQLRRFVWHFFMTSNKEKTSKYVATPVYILMYWKTRKSLQLNIYLSVLLEVTINLSLTRIHWSCLSDKIGDVWILNFWNNFRGSFLCFQIICWPNGFGIWRL